MQETQKNADFANTSKHQILKQLEKIVQLGDICADYLDYKGLVYNWLWWLICFGRKTSRTQEKLEHKDSTLGSDRFGHSVNEMQNTCDIYATECDIKS